ncbi:OLC1v1003755C3 [Oldenlandia corymbosa var. corymbosa]|uniref:OLC1v1003755C3 n=1 Tax=Oldenlandia corymbosa var. corymbosa TaxID=529605 RepID=A0AAV1DAQ9_OLDCO|nr:OLC1v1003755C3 [Oldenlandia corymbosa var. corymbosa]
MGSPKKSGTAGSMANGDGRSDDNGNGNEDGELFESTIRPGMKREFAMMMKAQAESGIFFGRERVTRLNSPFRQGRLTRSQNSPLGQGRVTRSQNSPLIKKSPGKNGDYFKKGRVKSSDMRKKKKIEDENVIAGEVNDVEMLGDDGEQKGSVAAEEEEVKSDIVDGNSDDEKKQHQDRLLEVNEIVDNQGTENRRGKENLTSEAKDGIVEYMNEDAPVLEEEGGVKVDSDSVAEEAPESLEKLGFENEGADSVEVDIRDPAVENNLPKDGISKCVCEDLIVLKEDLGAKNKAVFFGEDAPESVEKVVPEGENGDSVKVAASDIGTPVLPDNGVPERTYVRRFTRSLLKSKVEEVPKQSGTGWMVNEAFFRSTLVPEEERGVKVDSDFAAVKAPVSVGKVGLESEDGESVKVVAFDAGTPATDNRFPLQYARRFTRSLLKPKVGVPEQSGAEEMVDEEVSEGRTLASTSCSCKLEMKMSKKVELRKKPSRLKDLLDTGLLEGIPVRYVRSSRISKSGEAGLRGVIQGSEILCFCDDCRGIRTVTPAQFELHAGSCNKRQPEFIYLENGRSLRDVLDACKNASSDSLEHAIGVAIDCTVTKRPIFSGECKGPTSSNGTVMSDSCGSKGESQQETTESSDINGRSPVSVSSTKSHGKVSCIRSKPQTQGKLTKKDLGLHKLVFQSNYLEEGATLSYFFHGKLLNTGYKSGSGIFCNCCNQVVSPSVFEAHAGCASRRKPYLQIFTSKGLSLHEVSLAIKKYLKDESTDQNDKSTDQSDDVCSICEGMGELLCCDICPRAFHLECLNLASVPEGDWSCRNCSISSQMNMDANENALAAGRCPGIDPVEEVRKRCVRIVGAKEPDVGGCVLCRGHDFSKGEGFNPLTVIICDQCEREHHVGCLKEHGIDDLKELPKEKWFCCRECRSIHASLQQLVNDGEKQLPDHLLSIIRKKHEADAGSDLSSEPNVSWRLFQGKMASDEDKKWLSDSLSVIQDRFDPIGDPKKEGDDLIRSLIFGESFRNQDLGGMFAAMLIVNSRVVSAGVFRIFSQEVAEMPLVATFNSCQGKGYFRALFSCIENILKSLNVRDLVLPAAHGAESLWLDKLGFVNISAEQVSLPFPLASLLPTC